MPRHQGSINRDVLTVNHLLLLWQNWLDRNVYDSARQMRLRAVRGNGDSVFRRMESNYSAQRTGGGSFSIIAIADFQ